MEEGTGKIKDKDKLIKTSNKVTIIIILSLVAFGLAIVSSIQYRSFTKSKERIHQLQSTIIKSDAVIKEDEKRKADLDVQLQCCTADMETLKKRLDGIKNQDDLLKRDIFLYIDQKFQTIPRTVGLEIALQIIEQSHKENVPPELVLGIIQVESSFNPMAISNKNARGLMQVMPEWAPKFKLKRVCDLHDIDVNISCGIKVLKIHIEEAKGSISKGLYYYVGKSDGYASKVYEAMGKFVAFRSTVDDDKSSIDIKDSESEDKETEGNGE